MDARLPKAAHAKLHHPLAFNIKEASALYASGWSFYELATKYGLHQSTLCRAFKRMGIAARSISDSNDIGWPKRRRGERVIEKYLAGLDRQEAVK